MAVTTKSAILEEIDELISLIDPTMAAPFTVQIVNTKPYDDQKPGTSGLRKKVKVFQQEGYLENFIQATLETQKLQGATLILGGDGRYFMTEAIQIILKMCAGNGVSKVYVAQNGFFATPAVSAAIRKLKATGGIILTASHNPGGPDEDFGVKYNVANGGPASSGVTNAIFELSKTISTYKTCDLVDIDISQPKTYKFGSFTVEIIDATDIYVDLLKTIFDFDTLKTFSCRKDFRLFVSGLHGVAGPYIERIFGKELGQGPENMTAHKPLPDFGKGHPDPNLVYAKSLVSVMFAENAPDFGAAFDGDADRNMILGNNFFVTPSDSVAVIAANAECIPYFAKGLKGVARSMPTSSALDFVAKAKGIQLHETPTGWKYFTNLLENDLCSICGEESFGTGSDHIREKDGAWAMLCWLSILADANKGSEKLVTVEEIVKNHWKKYGRNYYTRYDYEGVEKDGALKMFDHLRSLFGTEKLTQLKCVGDEFMYTDPTDQTVAKNQGIRFIFEDGSRIIFRLSGTGSVGATIRMYIDKYEQENIFSEPAVALQNLIKHALELSKMQEFSGRAKPTVIT